MTKSDYYLVRRWSVI